MSLSGDLLEFARDSYGYGSWESPFWFLGPEQGKSRKTTDTNANRATAWRSLNNDGLCDCVEFHCLIGEDHWHRKYARLQPTWRPLILLLMAFKNQPFDKQTIREYQRDKWGRASGETCIIELSGLAAANLGEVVERDQFLLQRIEFIRQKIDIHKPTFVVMYGAHKEAAYSAIAGHTLIRDGVVKRGDTSIAFAPHPNTRGRTNASWERLGSMLCGYSNGRLGFREQPGFTLDRGFWEPLPEEELALWNGEGKTCPDE